MNKYRKFVGIFLCIELILIAISNVLFFIMAHINEPEIRRTQETTGTIYKVIYTQTDHKTLILMNVGMGIMFLLSVFLVMYIGKKILKPFHRMMSLTEELAKGNLSVPIKAEKSKFFGRFLWGMDMLRDNLESSREKELELQKEKKTIILSLAHDLKTPLSAIRLYNKALSENLYDTPEKRAQVYVGIDKNVTEMEGYVTEIMAASREEFLNLTVEMGEVYLSSVMEYINAYYTDKLSNLHTVFEVESYLDCLLCGDSNRLIEVLQNIMENALKYGDGKYITISFSTEEDCCLITVKNSGCTLKEDELPHLFDSFYRGSNVGNAKGSGLGLYICRQLMHMMDGEIFAEIKENEFLATVVIHKV